MFLENYLNIKALLSMIRFFYIYSHGADKFFMVEIARVELATFRLQTGRSPS
jgi:polyphosphate kinase